jgi:acyl-CoA thioesterase
VAAPQDCVSFFDSPEAPTFAKHFEAKFAGGAMPRTPDAKPEMTIWLRHRDAGDESSLVRLLALADALPPPSLVLSKEMMPFSTMTWSIDILDDRPFSTNGWWLAQARADTSQNGYSSHEIVIWTADGQPVAMARQNVAIFG